MNETTPSTAHRRPTHRAAPARPDRPIPVEQADHRSTPQRLLDAAERLFAEKGFADTSVRDLTAVADCNIAAVNYHFSSKENLYIEVFRRAITEMREHRVATLRAAMNKPGKLTCERFVRAFADSFMEPILTDPQRGDRLMQLYAREMAQPLLPDDMFHSDMFEPISQVSAEALMSIYPKITPEQVLMALLSLVGQLVHMVQRMQCFRKAGSPLVDQFDLTTAVEHIVRFTTAGIEATVNAKGSK